MFLFFFGVVAHIYLIDIQLSKLPPLRYLAQRSGERRYRRMTREFRDLAIALGGMQIKLGQFLSARADILPAYITEELSGLQDEVPAAPLAYSLAIIRAELGADPETLFQSFDRTPVAAASLGQVYYGVLHDGRAVAIKVQRPRIDEIIAIDLRAVRAVIQIIKNHPIIKRRANLDLLFDEFARVLRQELDYEAEAQNALRFRANFADTPGIYVPEPYPEESAQRVLVMERVNGIRLSDYAALDRAGISRAELAARINRIFLKMFFLDGFFHADPHPGNMFVRPEARPADAPASDPTPYTLILLDSGMVGDLPDNTMQIVRDGVVGVTTNNAQRIVDALDRMGMILPEADRRPIVRAFDRVLRITYNQSQRQLTNIDVDRVFDQTQDLVRELPFQIPQNLIYLGRSISMVSGLVTGLYPDINLFEETQPFAQQIVDRERRDGQWVERIQQEAGNYARIAASLPQRLDDYYRQALDGELEMRVDLSRVERGLRRVERGTARVAQSILAAALLLCGTLLRISGSGDEALWAWGLAAALALLALRR